MDVTHALLVALMFVGILSLGIAGLLSALPTLVDRRLDLALHWIPVSWLLLLLLAHFDLFWHTLDLLEVEDWDFAAFLYVIAGPVLLFTASSFMHPEGLSGPDAYRRHYFEVARTFFCLLAALALWELGVDPLLGDGWTLASTRSLLDLALFAVLAAVSSPRVHAGGTGLAWVLFVARLVGRALE